MLWFFRREMVEMKYKSIFTSAFLIIPFCVASGTSSEIFEQVYNYANFNDIESADFNNDGLDDFVALDFWTSDSSYYEVFLSNGDCSFARQGSVNIDTSGFGQILTGDFNEDSCDDMLLMNLEETWFYAGDGTGSFTLDDTFPWSYRNGCTGDVNNDDHLDLVGVNLDSWTGFSEADSAVVMLGDGAGDFSRGWVSRHYYSAYSSCLLAYFSGPSDTILDLCVAGHNNDNYGLLIFQGTGDGSFTDSTFYGITEYFEIDPTYHCTFGDFDEDNYTDIALAGTAGMNHPSVFIFLNQHDGTFESLQEGYFIGGCDIEKIATADLDLDGHLDLSVAGGEGSVAGYGDGTFAFNEFLSNKPYIDFVFMDMDLDGDLDLADKWGCVYRNTTIIQGCEEESAGSMMELILDVSPNPFSASVSIEVSGYFDGSGNLQIFDLSGRLVDELEPASSGGEAVFHWNGVSSSGAELSSGIYTARLSAGNTVTTAALLKLE
ncbi:MAG: T9SS type A sorting domain-containing protein [Candidatus Aegiribacteria sp.]|nr:T9SS type A sorting domain-containing protein [Candidatus Aegiribacteria sp.]